MRFRIVIFRPDRLSGWCTDPDHPGQTQTLQLMIDGAPAATLTCDLLRPELSTAEFANRHIGFLAQIPFEHWDGQKHHCALVVPATGETLHERRLTFPDGRLPEAQGRLFGRISVAGPHLVRGWATTGRAGAAALPVTLEVDGQTVARAMADEPIEEVRFLGCGFGFAVPARFFDDAEHEIRAVAALPGGERLAVGGFRRFLAREDAPRIEGRIALAPGGRIEGTALDPAHPDEALTLVVYLGDSERARLKTDPEAGGAFSIELAGLGACDPGTDTLEIIAEPFGQFLDFVPADLVAQALEAVAVPEAGGGWSLRVTAPLELTRLTGAELVPAQGEALPLDVAPDEDGRAMVAQVGPEAGPLEGATLRLGASRIPLRLEAAPAGRLAAAQALQASGDAAVPSPEAPPAPRQGLGGLRAPSEPAVGAALAALFGAPHPRGDAAWPEVSGSWRLRADGRLTGWAADLVRPERPLTVEVRANEATVARLTADGPACPSEAGLPLPVPLGFAADLGAVLPGPGRYRISVVLDGGLELPAAGERFLRWPPRADALPAAADMLGLPPRALPDAAEAALLVAPPDAALRKVLGLAFLGAPLDDGHPALAASLGGTLAGLLRGPFRTEDVAGRIEDPGRMLPGEASRPPLAAVDLAPLTAALPLSAAARAAVEGAQTWRSLLRALFSDDRLFSLLLDPEDARDALILADLRRLGRRGPPAATVRLDPVARPGGALPEALRGATAIAVYDANGRQVLAARTGGDDRLLARQLWQVRPAAAEGEAPRGPWRILVARGEGPWTDLRLVWETPEVAVAVPEAGGLRLRGLSVGGRLARVRLSGADLPETLVLRLDAQRVTLARVAPEAGDEAAGIGRYAGRLNQPPAEVVHALDGRAPDGPTWDLRVGAADGLRPVGLPAELLPVPGEIVAAPPVLAAGAFSGWAVSGVHGAEFAQIVLVEPEPPPPADAPPPAGGEEAAPPLPVIHATVAARTTSPEAQAACGEAFAAAGYRLALPASVLDGRPRRLVLEARAGAASLVLWSGDFAADEGVLTAQLRQCDTREALQDLLLRAAAAGQHRLIDAYFAAPRSISPHVLEAAEAFEILSAAILSDVGSRRPERMNRLYAGLWTHAQTSSQQQLDVLARALHVVLKAETGGSPARFPHGPLAELAVDLIVTMPRTKVSPDALAQFARAALAVRRLPLARQIVRDGLAEHPDAPALLVADAQVELALGAPARAEAMARKALEKKARHPEALLVLARALAVQGRPIEAAATISGGGGLSAWLDRPPSYEAAKLVAALDWPGVIRAVAQASDRQGLLDDLARADAVLGAPVAPEAGGYTLAFLDPGKSPPDLAPLFAALAPGGCTQVALVPGQTMSEIECIGAHALVFRTARAVSPDLVQALFAQTRPADQIVRLVECKLGKTGAPESPESITTVGALVGVAALRAFGEVDFPTFMARAEGALRIKTVLI